MQRFGMVRLDREGPIVTGERLLPSEELDENRASIEEGVDGLRVEGNRLIVARQCVIETPELLPRGGPGHVAACHYPLERWPMSEAELSDPAAAAASAPVD